MIVTYIKWLDASNQMTGLLYREDLRPKIIIRSAGVLIGEDDDTVSLSMDYWKDEDGYRFVQHIPKVNILKRRDIKVSEK